MKKIQLSDRVPDFVSPETKKLIKDKDNAYERAKTTGHNGDIRVYTSLRNKIHKNLRADKKYQVKTSFQDSEGNSRKQWAAAKKVLGWSKFKNPSLIVEDGKVKTTPTEIANSLNFNFIKKNIKLYREISKTETDPLTNYNKKLLGDKKPTFTLKAIDMKTLRTTIWKMKSTPSTGVDLISMKTIKNIQKPIEATLLNLVNTTLATTQYPSNF